MSLAGSVTALDNSPQVGVSVQVLKQIQTAGTLEIIQKTQSDQSGQFQFFNLRPDDYFIRCYTGESFYYYHSKDGQLEEELTTMEDPQLASIVQVRSGKKASDIDFSFPPVNTGRWRTFANLDGLITSSIHSIHEASDGMMWFGGDNGVVYYDGESFKPLNNSGAPMGSRVRAIAEHPPGVLWFGEKHGLVRFDGERFKRFTMDNGLPSNDTLALAISNDGVLWSGTSGGTSAFDGERFNPHSNEIYRIALPSDAIRFLPNGRMLTLTPEGPLLEYNNELYKLAYQGTLMDFRVSTALLDSNQYFWFGSSAGASRYKLEDSLLHWRANITTREGLSDNAVSAMLEDIDGSIWFGTENGGISRYYDHGISTITTMNGLSSDQISVMQLQSNHNLWVGTLGGGLSLLERSSPSNFKLRQGLSALRTVAIEDDEEGNLWFGVNGGGVSQFDGRSFRNYPLLDTHGLSHDSVKCLAIDFHQNVWVGSSDGLLGVPHEDTFSALSGIDNATIGSIETIHFLDENQLLLGSATGLHRLKIVDLDSHGIAQRVVIDQTRFADTSVLDIEASQDGSLWIATETEGAYRIQGNETIQYGENEGLPPTAINDIYLAPDNNVYCATDNGVFRLGDRNFAPLKGESELLQAPCLSLIQTSMAGHKSLDSDREN